MGLSDLREKVGAGAARLFKRENQDEDDGANDGLRRQSRGGIGFIKGGGAAAGGRPWTQFDSSAETGDTSTLQLAVRGAQVGRAPLMGCIPYKIVAKLIKQLVRRYSACS